MYEVTDCRSEVMLRKPLLQYSPAKEQCRVNKQQAHGTQCLHTYGCRCTIHHVWNFCTELKWNHVISQIWSKTAIHIHKTKTKITARCQQHTHVLMQKRSIATHQKLLVYSPWHLRFVFFMLFISIVPNSCSGLYEYIYTGLSNVSFGPHAMTRSFVIIS